MSDTVKTFEEIGEYVESIRALVDKSIIDHTNNMKQRKGSAELNTAQCALEIGVFNTYMTQALISLVAHGFAELLDETSEPTA